MRRQGRDGYTLLEVLVAFVILAGAVIMSFRIFADGLGRLNDADRQIEKVTLAQELMARLQLATRLKAGTTSGSAGELGWTITLTQLGERNEAVQAVSLFHVRIEVRQGDDGKAPSYDLETHLLAVPE